MTAPVRTSGFVRLIEVLGARLARAELTLAELEALDERELEVLFLVGQVLHGFGKYQAALDVFSLLALHRPLEARTWRACGAACQSLQRWAQAALAFERALAMAPGDVATWAALGEARLLSHRVRDGLADLRRVVELAAGRVSHAGLERRARVILRVHGG